MHCNQFKIFFYKLNNNIKNTRRLVALYFQLKKVMRVAL